MQILTTTMAGQTVQAAMTDLGRYFQEHAIIAEPAAFARAVAKREALGSTYIGAGIATPHYVAPGLNPTLVIAQSQSPLAWPDGHTVHLCLVLVLPPGVADAQMIKLMTALADATWLQRLSTATLPVIQELIRQVMEG